MRVYKSNNLFRTSDLSFKEPGCKEDLCEQVNTLQIPVFMIRKCTVKVYKIIVNRKKPFITILNKFLTRQMS